MIWNSKAALKKRISELKQLVSSHNFHIKTLNKLISLYDKEMDTLEEKLVKWEKMCHRKDMTINELESLLDQLHEQLRIKDCQLARETLRANRLDPNIPTDIDGIPILPAGETIESIEQSRQNDERRWPYEPLDLCVDGAGHEYPEEWNDTILPQPPCKKCGLIKED